MRRYRWLVVVLLGAWLGVGVVAIGAEGAASQSPLVKLSKAVRGEEAIQALGDKLAAVAEAHHMQAERLRDLLRRDHDLLVDIQGRLLYTCGFLSNTNGARVVADDEPVASLGDDSSFDAPYPLSRTFLLHSRPGASKTIFLDFDGHTVSNSVWENGGDLQLAGYYSDINSSSSKTQIQQIWAGVAEDYAPFDVDVTTEEPGTEALRKTGTGDTQWGIRACFTKNKNLLTGNAIINAAGGGTAYYNSFNWSTDEPALIFNTGFYTGYNTASHEIGHTLNLHHDGGATAGEYYGGHGTGATSWAPIMGASWLGNDEVVVQWSKGEYYSANETQDDLAVITSGNGFGYRADDHGNTIAGATSLTASGNVWTARGLIETQSDVDFFAFTLGGNATITVNPYNAAPNLDILARLYDSNGNLIQESNPGSVLNVATSAVLTTGAYYLSVTGAGAGTPLANPPTGYTRYGSLGQYELTITAAGSLTCLLTAPTNGAAYTAPASITLAADASNTVGTIAKVEFFNSAAKIGEDTTGPYAFTWTNVTAGSYTLTAKATDNDGATKTSAVVSVTVTAPGVSDTTDDQLGVITAQGENGTAESRLKAFDNSASTKWLDFATANPATRASWIQYAYATGVAGELTYYTITSANDVSARDPAVWQLMGSDNGGSAWTVVDSRSNVVFSARLQKQTFAVSGMPTYKAYRLNILKVADPVSATCVQLAEIELLGEQVPAPNQAPVAFAQSLTTAENTARDIALAGDDADGDPLTYNIVSDPAHGSLGSLVGANVTYTPSANYNGADSFTFKANDGTADSAPATVSITVTPRGYGSGVVATGGTVTNYALNGTNFTAHIFTTVGTTNLNVTSPGNVEVLVVAGGGGGGRAGGGGGGGGLIYSNAFPVVSGSNYTVTVGAGGAGSTNRANRGSNGSYSSFASITATGGGGGGSYSNGFGSGASGGSGGGGTFRNNTLPAGQNAGGSASPSGQGNAGGSGSLLNSAIGAGGGGGASAVGGSTTTATGGNGGAGLSFSLSGTATNYAGGGGGGATTTAGTGGAGGGGNGATGTVSAAAGKANTGGGGGGSRDTSGNGGNGGDGGSGIVIIRYVTGGGVALPAGPTGLTATAAGTNRIELAWTDNVSAESGYVVDRSLDSNAWAFVTLTGADATNHSDTGLTTNTLYYYRVAASNAAGLSAYGYAAAATWTDYEAWRRANFTAGQLADPDISGDDADPDLDRFSNKKEYLAGTKPNDKTSYLGFTALGGNPSAANEVLVYWQSATGRLYTLQATTNLVVGFDLLLGAHIQATPPINVYTDNVTGVEQRFYRVRLEGDLH